MTTREQYRQGDVLVELTEETLPAEAVAVPRDGGRVVLAYGEVTGHAHALRERTATLYRDPSGGAPWLVIASAPATVEHEEHASIVLAPSTYRVRRQREYSPEEIIYVVD